MNMYNLIEYSDNYSDSTASLYHYKRQEPLENNANLTVAGSTSFSYKSGLFGGSVSVLANRNQNIRDDHRLWQNVQIIVPLKYISSIFKSLEMPLINTKINIQLNYSKNAVISTGNVTDSTNFKITKTELYVPVVTLNIEDNNKLETSKSKNNKFKRTVYWNEYKSKIEDAVQIANNTTFKITLSDTSISGVNRLFVAAFPDGALRTSHRRYFLPSTNIRDYSILIDGRNFYDHNISDNFKKHEELRKVMTARGEDYTTGYLLDYYYWKNNYKLICCDLSKQKVLDSNPKANQQVEFVYKLGDDNDNNQVNAQILTVLEKEKEATLEFTKGTVKVY